MERPLASPFRLSHFLVRPSLNMLSGPSGESHLEPKVMDVLVLLAQRSGDAVSKEEIATAVWKGAAVSDDALVRCVSELRKALGDTPKSQNVIQTIPKMGYRLVPPVLPARQKRSSTDLTEIQHALDSILTSCNDHIYVYDRGERWLYASEAGAKAVGLSAEEMVGKTWRELDLPADVLEPFFQQVRSVLDGGPSVKTEVSYPVLAGMRIYEYVLDPMHDDDENIIAVVACVRDVTDQRRSAEEIRKLRRELIDATERIARALLPGCPSCGRVHAPSGQWVPPETLRDARPSPAVESLCPDCDRAEAE